MKRWQVLALTLSSVAVVIVWLATDERTRNTIAGAVGINPAAQIPSGKSKPVCNPKINPNVAPPTDCVPQYVADLPPDPGAAGLKTIEGIDADKDGVRDDVQRFIVINYGHSQRAVKALTLLAKSALHQVKVGDTVSASDAFEFANKQTGSYCFMRSVNEDIAYSGAAKQLELVVANTREREAHFWNFQQRVSEAARGHQMPDLEEPLEKLCGYDPAKLPN